MIWPILEKMRSHETEFKRVQWNFLASVISRGYTFLFWFQYSNGSEFLGGRSSSKYVSISWMAMTVFVVQLAEIQSSRLYQIESVFWADDEAGTGTLTYKNRKQIKKKDENIENTSIISALSKALALARDSSVCNPSNLNLGSNTVAKAIYLSDGYELNFRSSIDFLRAAATSNVIESVDFSNIDPTLFCSSPVR